MGRTSDRIFGACLRVVRVATVLVVLALVGGTVYLLVAPATHTREAGAAPASKEPPPAPRTPTASTPRAAPLPPLETKGATPLVRRLEIGAELNLLRKEVERDGIHKARFEERYVRAAPFLLRADGSPASVSADPDVVLRLLTEPRRDLERLVLAGARADDPLGGALRVRAWTLGEPYPAEELERVTRTIDHIVRRSGRDVPGGIDVLVTPEMGDDVFPFQNAMPWAAGVYFRKDRYCVTRAGVRPEYRPEVVEHECIHAICGAIPSFSTSRFVTEGIAEYLRLADPGDLGLRIPRDRFAHQCARLALLIKSLEAHGVNIGAVDPRRLVDLSPQDFYALRSFSYLVAQLTMAYVGGDVIERALAAGSDDAIVADVRAIRWPEFLEFVREEAAKGHAGLSVVVEDAVAEEAPPKRGGAAVAEALRAIGTAWPADRGEIDPALVQRGPAGELGTEERVVAALKALFDNPRERCCFVGVNVSKERRVAVGTLPDAIQRQIEGTPDGTTPRSIVKALLDVMQRRLPRNVIGWVSADREAAALAMLVDLAKRDLTNLVFFVDTGGAALQFEWPADSPPRVVLVVDLSEGGEGVDVALRFDRKESLVAYWRFPLEEK